MGDYQSEFERKVRRTTEAQPVTRREEYGEEREKPSPQKEERAAISMYAALVSIFKKFFSVFSEKEGDLPDQIATTDKIFEEATLLKRLLLELSEKDLSRDMPYSERLSLAWHQLSHTIDIAERVHVATSIDTAALSGLITAMKTYPPGAAHSLGYYLTAHAGEEWLPFPYIEMLSELHKEFLQDPKRSILASWIETIDKALQ